MPQLIPVGAPGAWQVQPGQPEVGALLGRPLSAYQGDFLLVKCFFFLALMRPTDSGRRDKYLKWQYRRALFAIGLEQYESSCSINTEAFPSLAEFSHSLGQAVTGPPGP